MCALCVSGATVHELFHEVCGDAAAVLDDFVGDLEGSGQDVFWVGEDFAEEGVEEGVFGWVCCAGGAEVEGFGCTGNDVSDCTAYQGASILTR